MKISNWYEEIEFSESDATYASIFLVFVRLSGEVSRDRLLSFLSGWHSQTLSQIFCFAFCLQNNRVLLSRAEVSLFCFDQSVVTLSQEGIGYTTLPSLRFSTLSVFPPSLRELL